jgi:DNA adenine methylase
MRNSYNIQRFNINHKTFSNLWIPRAAQMIFLNKLCYNGLFRQNLLGAFNVPFGKNYNPEIFDEINLFKISELLKNVEINTYDFHLSCKEIKTDSFVYLDPPYMPLSATSKFTHYCSSNFTLKDHIRVTELISTLNHNNVKFMLTNSTTFNDELIKDKYSDFKFSFINASRMMSSRIEKRGFVTEVIITNY